MEVSSRKAYSTDLTDEQWEILELLIPPAQEGGRHRSVDMREVVNALLYQSRSGCQWGLLPHDLVPKSTAYHYFSAWRDDGTWQSILDTLRGGVRLMEAHSGEGTPSAASIDSQTVKTGGMGGDRGYDGGKKITGRVRETLLEVAATPRHLGAQIGGLMVLHTWGQTLELHPHVHVIVPGGGLSADGTRWISCKPGFFLPVRVLSRLLRGKLLTFLRQAYDQGKLSWTGGLAPLADSQQFARFLAPLYEKEWAVYAKPPFGGAEQSLKYLARYTYRVAISNDRIESLTDGQVTFRYKDYAHGHRWRRMTLTAHEFLRRFLQHVLPRGFVRIRSFGLLANRGREEQLAHCRQLLGASQPEAADSANPSANTSVMADAAVRCPHCGHGILQLVVWTSRPSLRELVAWTYQRGLFDSS